MQDRELLEQLRIERGAREDGSPERRGWWLLVSALLVAAVAAAAFYTLRGRAAVVETVTATIPGADAANSAVLEATGYVTARREATVSTKLTGKLADVLIDEGDRVVQGQVLARLDDTDAKAQLQLAQAQVAAARSQLGRLEAQRRQAQRDLERQRELRARGLASQQALENARTQLDTLRAELIAQRDQVGVSEAQLHIARVAYDDTIVRAPFSGVVVAKAAQAGEIVSPISAGGGFTRTGICTIVDMDSLEIEVDVNEAYINRIQPRQPVQAVLDAYPEWQIPGEVIAVVPTADRSKATVKVRVALHAKDPRILPDMGVRVSFLAEPDTEAHAPQGVLVPASAIVQRDGRSVVFVVDGEHAHRRAVTPSAGAGDLRLIESGLRAGERVVRDPPPGLDDGMRVQVRARAS